MSKKKPEDIYELNAMLYTEIDDLQKELEQYKLMAIIDKNNFLVEEDIYLIVENILNNVDFKAKNIEIYVKEIKTKEKETKIKMSKKQFDKAFERRY